MMNVGQYRVKRKISGVSATTLLLMACGTQPLSVHDAATPGGCNRAGTDGNFLNLDAGVLAPFVPDGGLSLTREADVQIQSSEGLEAIALNPATGLAYAVGRKLSLNELGIMAVIDARTSNVTATVSFPEYAPLAVAVESSTNSIFVVAEYGPSEGTPITEIDVLRMDACTNEITTMMRISTPDDWNMAVDPTLQRLYFAGISVVHIVDIAAMKELPAIKIPNGNPGGGFGRPTISVDPTSHDIYAFGAGGGHALLTVFDGRTHDVKSQLAVGNAGLGMFDPTSGKFVYATSDSQPSGEGLIALPIPADVTARSLSVPIGCGTAVSHDWTVFGQDPSFNLAALQYATDGTLLRRTTFTGPQDVDLQPVQTVSTGQYLLTLAPWFPPGEPNNTEYPNFLKRHRCY
jgi:DNA-binding beta-propeller fold protein YncE